MTCRKQQRYNRDPVMTLLQPRSNMPDGFS